MPEIEGLAIVLKTQLEEWDELYQDFKEAKRISEQQSAALAELEKGAQKLIKITWIQRRSTSTKSIVLDYETESSVVQIKPDYKHWDELKKHAEARLLA